MFPPPYPISAEHAHSKEAKGEVDSGEEEVDTKSRPAIFATQFAETSREGEGGFGGIEIGGWIEGGFGGGEAAVKQAFDRGMTGSPGTKVDQGRLM